MELCICGHPKDDHGWPGYAECLAGENDLGDVFCACTRYQPITVPHPAAPGADGGQ
jgi:hypothetical protein